jgi:hypothetical protein
MKIGSCLGTFVLSERSELNGILVDKGAFIFNTTTGSTPSLILVYYFIVVHQSAEPGREADVARGDTDRPTPPIPAKPMAQERTTLSTVSSTKCQDKTKPKIAIATQIMP